MENKSPTIHDIAKALNISASTVSRALNNHPSISKKTVKKIKEMAENLGYKPNVLATNLRTGKSNAIGLIVPRINRSFFSDTISGIEQVTSTQGYNLIICQSDEKLANEKQNIITLVNSRVDGIIISVTNETTNAEHLEIIKNSSIPLVFFDRVIEDYEACQVVNDNYKAAYNVVQHLISQGYQRIVHFAGSLNNNIYRDRKEGYEQALKDNGLPYESELIFHNTITKEEGEIAARKIADMSARPDAIFSSGDYAALGAMLVFKSKKIRVPEDMGIAGFANEPFTQYLSPSLTTVNQFGIKVGIEAANLILQQIKHKDKGLVDTFKKVVPTKLCLRSSSLRK